MLRDVRKSTALFEGSIQASLARIFDKSNVKVKVSMVHWWNYTDKRKWK